MSGNIVNVQALLPVSSMVGLGVGRGGGGDI